MTAPTYFKPWIIQWTWGVRIALFLILLSGVVQFVAFSLSQSYVIAYTGAQPEDITYSIQLTYVGILSMLPIVFRLLRYFEIRSYLICFIIFGILLSIACLYTVNITMFFIIRFFQGAVVCAIAGSMLILIPNFLQAERRQSFGSTIFYGTVLSSSVLIGVVASDITPNMDIVNIYYYLIVFQVFTLVIVLLCFNARTNMRPYPLYQIDWAGTVFFIAGASALAYTMIYGSKYYWFNDRRIVLSACIVVSGASLYLYRQYILKRPSIDISVFKYRNFWIGLILLALYYGMKESINLIFGYTASVLQWSPLQVTMLGLCNVAGLIVFMIISARLLVYKKNATLQFLLAGFGTMLLYHLWMYFIFTPDLSFEDLIMPMFLQGAASGILFVPIMIFTLSSIPPTTGIAGLLLAAFTRFFSLLNATAGFYNLQLYYNQLFKESFLYNLSSVDQQTTERLNGFRQLYLSKGFSTDQANSLANNSLAKVLSVQSQLLTNRAVFLFIAIIVTVILILVLAVYIYDQCMKWKQRSLEAVMQPA